MGQKERICNMSYFSDQQLQGLKTPCFIIDEAELSKNFEDFKNALSREWGSNSIVAYSVKTNPHPLVLHNVKDCNCMAEVVSDDEFDLALKCGFTPSDIVFNGPCKTKVNFCNAILKHSLVNIDSNREIRWVKELSEQSENVVKVGLRVNIDMERFCPGETIGGKEPGRFGFCFETGEAARALEEIQDNENAKVVGLHLHVTTYGRKPYAYEVLAKHAVEFAAKNNIIDQIEFIDIGGGFFGGGEQNVGRYEEYASAISNVLRKVFDPFQVKLIVEPGGAVICTPGYYVGKVLDVKNIQHKRFVVTELSRLCVDHEQKKTSYAMEIYSGSQDVISEQRICGFTCLESDRLCVLENQVELKEDDIILIKYAGAYSWSFVPGFFISNPPTFYSYNQGKFIEYNSHLQTNAVRNGMNE